MTNRKYTQAVLEWCQFPPDKDDWDYKRQHRPDISDEDVWGNAVENWLDDENLWQMSLAWQRKALTVLFDFAKVPFNKRAYERAYFMEFMQQRRYEFGFYHRHTFI